MVEQTKKCNKCGEVKDVSLFSKNCKNSDGFTGQCKSCRKVYYEANKEAVRGWQKAYYEANKEAIREKHKAHYQANKEATRERHKSYREANKEAVRGWQKAHYEANKDIYMERSTAYKAKKKTNTPKFIRECPVDKQRRVFAYKLARLLTETTGVEHHVDHMWPISDGGPHWSGNLQVIPAVDNLSKSATVDAEIKKTIKEDLKYARQAYKKALEEAKRNA